HAEDDEAQALIRRENLEETFVAAELQEPDGQEHERGEEPNRLGPAHAALCRLPEPVVALHRAQRELRVQPLDCGNLSLVPVPSCLQRIQVTNKAYTATADGD